MKHVAPLCMVSLAALVWLAGCGGGDALNTAANTTGIGAPGTVKLLVADAPADGVSQVNVNITRVDLLYDGVADSEQIAEDDQAARDEDTGGEDSDDIAVTLSTHPTTIDLLSLANRPLAELFPLIETAVPSGHYKQLRLYLGGGNTVVLQDGTTKELKVPSNVLKVPLSVFVSPEETERVLIDFVLSDHLHLHQPGNGQSGPGWYVLNPVVRVAPLAEVGSVTGMLTLPTAMQALPGVSVRLTLPVGAQAITTDADFVLPEGATTLPASAPFALHGIPAGTYTITVVATGGEQPVTFTLPDATVTAGQTTELGEVAIPAP